MSVEGVGAAEGTVLGPLEVGPIAHGGHCVSRHEGRVIFVRHALPGERVRVRITDTGHDRFWRGDAVEILEASPDRVDPWCPVAGPGRCGGCDFQHVDLAAQRRLKATVVAEQLRRLAGLEWDGKVEPLPGPGADDGLGWRTRMRYRTDAQGRPGLRRHRSREVQALPASGCPLAHPGTPVVAGTVWSPDTELVAATSGSGAVLLRDRSVERVSGDADPTGALVEHAAGRSWSVPPDGFWQVHPAAANTLVEAVAQALAPRLGERAFDLYAGVGLFSGALADAGCTVWSLESSRSAVAAARRNLADAGGQVRLRADRVESGLARLPARVDLVVLDPPRAGAGAKVIKSVLARAPRAVAYVACDPAALARDLATAGGLGYQVASLRAFDLFPMTQHVECVAVLQPGGA